MADFLILSDYPAIADNKRSLNDNVGRRLWALLYSQGFPSADSAVEFLFNSPADIARGNDKWRAIEAKHKPKVILALGKEVCKVLGINGSIFDIRGSVIKLDRRSRDTWVIPTFNPRELKKPLRMFADEKLERSYFTAGDIKRAVTTYHHGWKVPAEKYNLEPTLGEVRQFVADSIREDRLLGCDLEATGLSIEHSEVFVMGFAWNESEAMVVPLLTEGGRNYWNKSEYEEIVILMNKLFRKCRFVFQNGIMYDVPLLRARGWEFPLESIVEDTMVQHHIIAPELPHKIGFISAQYGKQPFWKDSFLSKKMRISDLPDTPGDSSDPLTQQGMRLYNARDCVALHQIRNGMNSDMKEKAQADPIFKGLKQAYKDEMATARVVMKMGEAGIKLDKHKVSKWQGIINEEVSQKKGRLYTLAELPPSFNFGSTNQMRLLLYSERPQALDKILEDIAKYELPAHNYQYECKLCSRKVTKKFYENEKIPNIRLQRCPACKKDQEVKRTDKERTPVKGLDKNTKTYKELALKAELARVKPLYKLKNYYPLMTKSFESPGSAIDKAAIVRYIVWIDKRLDALKGMRRKLAVHFIEEVGLPKTRTFLLAYMDYTQVQTLQSNFYEFQTWGDGKVRPRFFVTGTSTGRFSCKNPNLQQIPSRSEFAPFVRDCFRADPGWNLLSVDFSNLEVQVGARFMKDDVLIDQLEKGQNLHDENTKTFFDVTPDNENWSNLRKAAKTIQFGRLFYGGTDNGIFSKVITEVPESGLSLKIFKTAVRNYMEAHPIFAKWVEEVQALAIEQRISPNAFGRVRTLLGDEKSIERIALNNPIQGSAADVVSQDIVALDKAFVEAKLKTEILLQVHDELIFHVPDEEIREAGKIIQRIMNRKRKIGTYTFRIPIDPEIGTNWGSMNSIDLTTGKITEGGKHL